MNTNFTIIMDLLRKSTVVLIVLILVQVIYDSDRTVIPETLEQYTQINGNDTIRFSAESGFYEESFSLAIEAEGILPRDAQIRYTMDGTEPDKESALYDGPILLEAAPVSDARDTPDFGTGGADGSPIEPANENGGLPAQDGGADGELNESLSSGDLTKDDTSGAHYAPDHPAAATVIYTVRAKIICGEEESATKYGVFGIGTDVLPGEGSYIVCVDTEASNLYDYDTGILVGGRDLDEHDGSKYYGNYMMRGDEWVRPCYLAVFDGEGTLVDARSAGMSVSGGMSRRLSQKSLNFAFGEPWCGEDGNGHLDLDIFPDRRETDYAYVGFYTHLRLRARSQVTRTFRESMVCEAAGKSGVPAVVSSRSGIVFLNGSFYTLAELEPTFSNSYLCHRYDLPDTDHIEKKKGKESSVFEKMNVSDLFAADLTQEKNRQALEAAVDMDDYLLYYAVNVLDNNLDWPRNNVEAWRYTGEYDPEYPCTDGRLRFTVFDSDKTFNTDPSLEETFGTDNFVSMMTNKKRGYESRFRDVMKAQIYRERFATILCDLMNTSFEKETIQQIIRQNYDKEEGIYRAYYTDEYMGRIEEDEKAALDAAAERNDIVRQDLEEYFGMKDSCQISLTASDGVSVRWNNMYLAPKGEYTCSYLKGVHITYTASPAPGWVFDHWEINGAAAEEGAQELTLTLDTDQPESGSFSVRAVAVPEEGERLIIAEISAAGTADWIRLYNAGTTELNLGSYCISDEPENPQLFRLPSMTLAPGESFRVGGSRNDTESFPCRCSFSLSENEVLTLTPDETTGLARDSVRVPYMSGGFTYGRRDNGSSFCWFDRRQGE